MRLNLSTKLSEFITVAIIFSIKNLDKIKTNKNVIICMYAI